MNRETLGQSLKPLVRWWWLILASALVAGATSLLYVRLRPDIYQSHASLVVGSAMRSPNPDSLQVQMGSYLARSYADMAQRSTVQDATKAALNMGWLPEYTVVVNPDSQMIEITVNDNDPKRAQAVASELVHQLVLQSPGGADAENRNRFAQQQLSQMENDISTTETEIANRRDELGKATSARQIVSLEGEVSALETKLGSLRGNYVALLSTTRDGAVNALNILEAPSLPTLPESSNGMLLVLLATVMGGILAAAGAYLLDFLDDSITITEQAEEALGLSILGTVPAVAPPAGAPSASHILVMRNDPHTVAAEAFRVLRANVLFASIDTAVSVLQVTSPSPGDGKSSVTANLAIAMAHTGKRVILLDGDLRRPEQHRIFGLRNNNGVTSALIGDEKALISALQPTGITGLSVLTSGPLPPNPAELLGSRRFAALIESLKGLCDLLIIDSPPVSAVADTAVLASQVDGVVLVLWAGRTRRQQARYAVGALRNARARILGVVLNGVTRATSGYNYYHAVERYAEYGVMHARPASAQTQQAQPPKRAKGSTKSSSKGSRTQPTRNAPAEAPAGFDLVGGTRVAQTPMTNPLSSPAQSSQPQKGQPTKGQAQKGQTQTSQTQTSPAQNSPAQNGAAQNGHALEGGAL